MSRRVDTTRRVFLKRLPHLAAATALGAATLYAFDPASYRVRDSCSAQGPCQQCRVFSRCELPRARAARLHGSTEAGDG